MLETLALCLGLTLLLELPTAALLGLRRRNLLLCALVNVLTNPAVVVLHALAPRWPVTLLLEVGAILVEGDCYRRFGQGIARPWRLSLLCNIVSYGLGLMIQFII